MQRLVLSLLIGLFSFCGLAQNTIIDSLINRLEHTKVDSAKYKIYVNIAEAYADSSSDKALVYFNKALPLAEKSTIRSRVAYIYQKIGFIYLKKGEFPTALSNFNIAIEINEFLNNKKEKGKTLNDIGLIYKNWGKYDKALENYLIALKIFEDLGDEAYEAIVSNNIGQLYYYREDYQKSITYFKKYLDVNIRNRTMRAVAGASNNIASAYLELNQLDNALDYYIRAMRLYDSLGIKVGVAIIKDNIGSLYIRKKQYHDALLYSSEAAKLLEELGSQTHLSASLQCVGLAYTKLYQPDQAIKNLNRSLEIALRLNLKEAQKDIYETFSEVYTQTKQYDKALDNYKLYREIRDSLLNSETISKIETIQAEYESEKKEKNLVEINQKLHNQKILGLLAAGLIILFIFLFALIIRENQLKKKTIRKAESQTGTLNQIISKSSKNLIRLQKEKVILSPAFTNSWEVNSFQNNSNLHISVFIEHYLILAFISVNSNTEIDDIIHLAVLDFLNSSEQINFDSSIKEQFNRFINLETHWRDILNNQQLMNIDFWCYNTKTNQQIYSGTLNAYFIDNEMVFYDLSKYNNTWLKIEKGNRLFFCTTKNLNSFILDEKDFFHNTVGKTISKSIDQTFVNQKDILNNSLELIESGSEHPLRISINGYIV